MTTQEQNQARMKEMTIAIIVTSLRRHDFEDVISLAKQIPDFLDYTYDEIKNQPVIGLVR
jgi:hypothetical protein